MAIEKLKRYMYQYNHRPSFYFFSMMSDGGDYWNNVFITPWCRVSAYCIGILLGFLIDTLDSNKKVKIRKVTSS